MENFSAPLLADSENYNNNNIINNTNNINMHHHKDHMLAAGSTPSTTSFMYDSTQVNVKGEMSMPKSDYSAFTACIQQSALLDHRSAIDSNLDAGVSLGALCDLKFSGVTPSILSDSNTNFKGLPPLLSSLETNQIMSGLQKLNTTMGSLNTPSFSNILFARESTTTNSMNNNNNSNDKYNAASSPTTHYMTLKVNEVQNTAETTQQQQIHHYLTNATITGAEQTVRQMTPTNDIISRGNNDSSNHHLLDYGIVPSSASSLVTDLNDTTDTAITNRNGLKSQQQQSVVNEHVITTTTAITNDTHNTANMNGSSNNNNNNSTNASTTNHAIQQQTLATSTTSTRSTVNSIEELAASSCTPTSSTSNSLNTLTNNGNNIATATSSLSSTTTTTTATATTTATTVPSLVNSNETPLKYQQQRRLQQHNDVPVTGPQTETNNSNNQQQQLQYHQLHQQIQQHQHHNRQQTLLNSTILSSDSNDSLSSSDDYHEMELNERSGYQDTTSSHSQHSGNGGGGGNGNGPSSNPSAAGVSLINGVVTLNAGQNAGLTGGSNNGGSSASSASGTFMSLLPPNIGATSSSTGHLGGVGGGLGGGTSASAGGSGPDVIDFKHLFEELCPVCGDKVSGYHYGLLTCESCKGFFKRTVQNKKVYTCVAERSCHIDKTQRKRCPYCRFQKCLEVGMKLEAVRADRMRGGRNKFGPMYKRDRARKLQIMRSRQLALQEYRKQVGTGEIKQIPISPGYQQGYTNMNIKQEIQIPQVSSLTQSPDSSPSPIAIALGQVNASSGVIATPMNGNSGAGGGGGGGGGGGNNGNNNNNNNNNNTSDGINRVGSGSSGGSGNCHETGTGSLQSASDSKLCFDSGTHPSSTADSIIEPLRVSPMIREFVQSIDDREWQTQLFALLQKQTYNQVEVDLFELMCKVLDQNLFSQVDWARNTVFFKDLKVDDQMKLLQHSWSDMLVLDHLHQRIHNGLPDETQLNNGQVFNLLSLGLLGVPHLGDFFNELQNKLQDLKFDMGDYVCMKFLILLNPDVRGILNKKTVLQGHENVQAALLDYTLTCYPSVTDKFRRLLCILPDIHAMATRGEEHLYSKHCAGSAPTQTLLMEMLHAKRKV